MLLLHSGGHKKGMYYVIGYKFKYCLKRYSCNYKKANIILLLLMEVVLSNLHLMSKIKA